MWTFSDTPERSWEKSDEAQQSKLSNCHSPLREGRCWMLNSSRNTWEHSSVCLSPTQSLISSKHVPAGEIPHPLQLCWVLRLLRFAIRSQDLQHISSIQVSIIEYLKEQTDFIYIPSQQYLFRKSLITSRLILHHLHCGINRRLSPHEALGPVSAQSIQRNTLKICELCFQKSNKYHFKISRN